MINSDANDSMNSIISDSKRDIKWMLDLDCFILKIIGIPSTKLIWVIASQEKVFLIDGDKAKVIKKFEHIAEIIFSAVIQPENSDLILCKSNGVFLLTVDGKMLCIVEEDNWFEHLSISSDDKYLMVSKGKTLYSFEKKNGIYKLLLKDSSFKSTISDVIFNCDSFLISNYGGVREYNISNLKDYTLFEWKTSLLNLSWSPNKKYIAVGTQENAIHFWPYPLQKEEDFQMGGYSSKVNKTLWSDDSKQFVVNGQDDVHIWDFSDGPPYGKSPRILGCGYGKIVDIIYDSNLLAAVSEEGLIFYFLPSRSDQFINIQAIDAEITCLGLASEGKKFFVGSKSGELYCF